MSQVRCKLVRGSTSSPSYGGSSGTHVWQGISYGNGEADSGEELRGKGNEDVEAEEGRQRFEGEEQEEERSMKSRRGIRGEAKKGERKNLAPEKG